MELRVWLSERKPTTASQAAALAYDYPSPMIMQQHDDIDALIIRKVMDGREDLDAKIVSASYADRRATWPHNVRRTPTHNHQGKTQTHSRQKQTRTPSHERTSLSNWTIGTTSGRGATCHVTAPTHSTAKNNLSCTRVGRTRMWWPGGTRCVEDTLGGCEVEKGMWRSRVTLMGVRRKERWWFR
jgi:hypothetical protein